MKPSDFEAPTTLRVVLSSFPVANASSIAQTLVKEQLAACVQLLPPMQSVYTWDGEVTSDEEQLLLIKAPETCLSRLTARLLELHPYDVPEILVIEPSAALAIYARWASDVTESSTT